MSATNNYKVKLVLSIIEEHFGRIAKVWLSFIICFDAHSMVSILSTELSKKGYSTSYSQLSNKPRSKYFCFNFRSGFNFAISMIR
jgi:hypothetical protein